MIPLRERLERPDGPIVLYGMGNGADKILKLLEKRGLSAAGVFASDGFARGKNYRGFTVVSYAEAKRRFGKMTVLLAFGTHDPAVMENIKRVAAEQELYAPPFPVVGDEPSDVFSAAEAARTRALLADDASRAAFDGILRYRESGDLSHLFSCESGEDEIWGLMGLSRGEDYLDLGAYRGDTVAAFVSRAPGYRSVTAVEPDRRSFEKLSAYCSGLPGCRCFNVCIGRAAGEEKFSGGAGRGSSVSPGGESTRRESVDSLLSGSRVSVVKIDVEGAERGALEGARRTIAEFSPRLRVAAYHRAGDIFDLPRLVLDANPGYKVYLRHGACVPDWDADYIFVPA